jgi:hypothetical protein
MLLSCFLMLAVRIRKMRHERADQLLVHFRQPILEEILISELTYLMPYGSDLGNDFVLGMLWVTSDSVAAERAERTISQRHCHFADRAGRACGSRLNPTKPPLLLEQSRENDHN